MNESIRTGNRSAVFNAVAACGLFVVLLLCYYQGFNGPFLLDDVSSVIPAQIDALSISELTRVANGDKSSFFGRAIPVMSFALNNYLGDGSPYGFKVSNFLLHAITGVAIYAVLLQIFTRLNEYQKFFSTSEINKLALFCTAAWALHPLQISTVLYVVQRMAMLSALFSILALWLFLILRTTALTKPKRALVIVLMGTSILAACLSKENGVLAFVYIGFVELVVLRFRKYDGQLLTFYRRIFFAIVALTVLSAAFLLSTQYPQLLAGYEVRDYGIWERLMTEPGVLLFYLKLIALPNVADMSLYHDAYPVVRSFGLAVMIPAAVLLMLITASLLLYRKLPILLFGVGFFLISHSLESTFLPLELVFEHRNYLALIGVLAPITWLAALAVKSLEIRLPMKLLATAALALLSFQTFTRSIEWSDTVLLHRQALIEHPNSLRALNEWTIHLSAQGLNNKTMAHLEYSHQIRPDSPHFLIQLLMYSGAINGPNEQLFTYVREQMASNPLKAEEIATLRDIYDYFHQERFEWPDLTVVTGLYQVATTHSNKLLKAPVESLLFQQYSVLLSESGLTEKALVAAKRATQLDPVAPEPLLQLAQMQIDLERAADATNTLRQLDTVDRHGKFTAQRKTITNKLLQLSIAELEN
ncbi:hypothetical protein [Granulosicoccus antarcticus]|uniref:Glycosyltransferase RgtA/B/C/D-like domain-containing protein n=1 Tax=Granulosicoccus antarcticus IMCC3135 TaxID=1192854 RepID=A0A2Z2NZK7_9GAMM|nr:hypothetical protein [Granulosicoccus antarcticus]ASJ75865.1 hypothetical protein IMCC3135_29070 [Granulosicoccus antarcticus IMCC3135]